ncbi:M23 family metallopeptidase [Aureibaculum sp. 2210JD6-5]|uniref:M23 family metallopeptidase n=1 Tax=Aureibaculum sp. 2210JD6-5 TaxID=3103957 RepID=UPI002AADE0DD|nr:M23 family metallopeptidase [Aureibaculum sp. 2210JD6-5]MDY7394911.1 M23 family metallopeptidase [Aureibaculum sp. 2210JD6-5]
MAKVKYYYDSDTLSYKKVVLRKRDKFKKLLVFFLGAISFGLIFMFISFQFIESPKEKAQKRELENLKLRYGLLDKKMAQIEDVLEGIQHRDNDIYRLYFEANPIPEEQRKAGFGGVNRYKSLEGFENSEMIIDVTKKMDILSKQLYIQSKSLDEIIKLAEDKEKLLASIPAIQPVNNEDLTRMASGYGWRSDPFTKARKMHKGMDFTAPTGTPIYATGNGVVDRADNNASGFGEHIEIDHGFGYKTIYAHLSKYNVKRGQKVKRGDLIGFVGNTGRSSGPHLHYEVHKNGKPINPINFYYGNLTPDEFEQMLKMAAQEGQSFD